MLKELNNYENDWRMMDILIQQANDHIGSIELELHASTSLPLRERESFQREVFRYRDILRGWGARQTQSRNHAELDSLQRRSLLDPSLQQRRSNAEYEAHQRRQLLDNPDEALEYGQSKNYRDQLERTSLLLKDSDNQLNRSIRMLNESESQGLETSSALREQRATLEQSKYRLTEIDGDHRRGSQAIRTMEWDHRIAQAFLICVIITLIIAICLVFYFGIIRRFF